MNLKYIITILLLLLTSATTRAAERLVECAEDEMSKLEALITQAKQQNINTLKEETALRTAQIFMHYAEWDERNIETNEHHFSLVGRYKSESRKYAELLPNFERREIIEMMRSSISELESVISGEIYRLDSPRIDWSRIAIEQDAIVYDGRPVFLADWVWKPNIESYGEYHGNRDGYLISPSHVINKQGDIAPKIIKELESKPSSQAGVIFLSHANLPKWATAEDPTIKDGVGLKYTMYDISNPLAQQIQSSLIAGTVPLMRGQSYTKLGYMLCNEPHWNTIEGSWASAPISERAYDSFRVWLRDRHKSIKRLNALWGRSFESFESINTPRILQNSEQGTPLYFDFMLFNQERVSEWFSFLRSEILKYDPTAKTHIKIMPSLWSGGKRDHGIDIERLTRNSEIIGHDAGSCEAWMWGKPQRWEENYAMNWVDLCMTQDMLKSVSPNKITYNTEAHYLSTGKSRDLYQSPQYVRCNYWLATIHGLTISHSWYWSRREDGSPRTSSDSNAYAASNNHQPRVVNELHSTIIDLNSVSEEIMAFQRQRKPIRVFYSKATAINDLEYMNQIFSIYESLTFDGVPIGFATEGIIENNAHDWQMIVIYKTPQIFTSDLKALQSYLNSGGTIIIDKESLLYDEYNRPLKGRLRSARGEIIVTDNLKSMSQLALDRVYRSNDSPTLKVTEHIDRVQRGAIWRVIPSDNGAKIMTISNIGKSSAKISIELQDGELPHSITDRLTGKEIKQPITMRPYDTYLLEVR